MTYNTQIYNTIQKENCSNPHFSGLRNRFRSLASDFLKNSLLWNIFLQERHFCGG